MLVQQGAEGLERSACRLFPVCSVLVLSVAGGSKGSSEAMEERRRDEGRLVISVSRCCASFAISLRNATH